METPSLFKKNHEPLASKMRPQSLKEIIGQQHILGKDALLPKLIAKNLTGSLIFIGPPGCGKTSLAEAIAHETQTRFIRIHAATDGTKEIREAIEKAKNTPETGTTLFIDEIHRFNKAQQDQLLPAVENGDIQLIGATTHNPAFYIIPPLLSRSHLFRLRTPEPAEILTGLQRALASDKGLQGRQPVEPAVLERIAKNANGDFRQALNTLEVLAHAKNPGETITETDLENFAKERQLRYDRNEDGHYDTISAFIKSMRGCDPHATAYWLEKMLQSGEDPRFIARRMIIHASEDVGLADNRALLIATAAAHALEFVGMPEARLNLYHAALFIALAPKSDSVTQTIQRTADFLQTHPNLPVPEAIKDNHYCKPEYENETPPETYKNSHEHPLNISGQNYLPIPARLFEFKPADNPSLQKLNTFRDKFKQAKGKMPNTSDTPNPHDNNDFDTEVKPHIQ
jgi:putative ATPase